MRKRRPLSNNPQTLTLTLDQLEYQAKGWYLDCEIRNHSVATVAERKRLISRFLWWLQEGHHTSAGLLELRGFLAYVKNGAPDGSRWGRRDAGPVRPVTVRSYYNILRTWFSWMVAEGVLPESPVEAIEPPIHRDDQIIPFSEGQIEALRREAAKTAHPRRDTAIVLLLLDTGMRASECVQLRRGLVDMTAMRLTVRGKGDKTRLLPFGRTVKRALAQYFQEENRGAEAPLFTSDRGWTAGQELTRSGLTQLISRLGDRAGITEVRCSPHTFRHTFALSFLRNGGDIYSLKELLGHEDLEMVQRYLRIAQADVEAQHRRFSPVDRLKSR